MSLFFLLNNLHFSLEILGALVFLMVAWLAFDAFWIRRDFLTASRGIGFILLGLWQIIHAFGLPSEIYSYIGYALYFLGLFFIILNLIQESPVERPKFQAILVLPKLSGIAPILNVVITMGLVLVSFLSFRQYKKESKLALVPFILGFSLLALGGLVSIFYKADSYNTLWVLGHILELAGFLSIGWWVWSYLALRIKEELQLIFISVSLLMAIVVSLTFSTILVGQVQTATKSNLLTNTKVLDLTILRLKEEAGAKARLIASNSELAEALAENNFVRLEQLLTEFLQKEKLGFLAALNNEGDVILRAHALTRRDDNLAPEFAVKKALAGESAVTIEPSPAEGFAIRAASPLYLKEKLVGVVVAGFQLDNAFVDSIKKITGLEMSIFQGNTRVATTTLNPDGRTRSTGITEVDKRVNEAVFGKKSAIILRTNLLSRPYLSSYFPIMGAENQVVGMLAAAKAQRDLAETINSTNRLTLVTVVIIMLLLTAPIYLISRRLSGEVEG